jgi:hypothetical protein
MLTSFVTFNDNSARPAIRAPSPSPPLPKLVPNRNSGIRNRNNQTVFNHFHFSNRKYSLLLRRIAAFRNPLPPCFLARALIVTPRLKNRISYAVSATSDFSNRYKTRVSRPAFQGAWPPKAHSSLVTCHLLPPCLGASTANLCDNSWLN